MKKKFILIFLCLKVFFLQAQEDLLGKQLQNKVDSAAEMAAEHYDLALDKCQEAIAIADKNQRKDLVYKALRTLGNIYEDKNQLAKAQETYLRALAIAEKMPLEATYLYIYTDLAILNKKLGQFQLAREYHQKTIDNAQKINDLDLLGEGYHGMGTLYSMLSQFDVSIQYYFRAIDAAERLGDKKAIVLERQNISSIFRKAKNYDMARRSIAETYQLALEIKDSSRLASVLMVNAEIEHDAQNYTAALEKILVSKNIFAQKKKMSKYCEALVILGNIYFQQGKNEDAEKTWQECIAQKDYILPYEYASLYSKLGNLYLKKGDLQAAKSAIEKSLTKTNLLGYKEIALENQRILANIYEKQGNYQLANEANKQANNLLDSLAQVNNKRQMTEAHFLFDVEKRDAQIKAQQQEINYKAKLNWFYIGGIVLLLTSLFFILKQMNAKQKAQRRAELLLTELSHRVKNNLQTIASIMRLQSRQIKDKQLLSLFNESRQRLEAMTLLHHQFYKNDNIEQIDLQAFVNQIIDKLAFAYNFDNSRFSKNITIQNNPVHIKQAQPIALIINELATNSFKHAFQNTPQAKITILLTSTSLRYSDNGCGLSTNHKKGLGMDLIEALAEQLEGEAKFSFEEGLCFDLRYKGE